MEGLIMELITNQLLKYNMDPTITQYISTVLMILFIGILCIIGNFITKGIVIRIITHYVKKTSSKWDDIILERKIFRKLSHIVPAIIIFSFSSTFPTYQNWIEKGAT